MYHLLLYSLIKGLNGRSIDTTKSKYLYFPFWMSLYLVSNECSYCIDSTLVVRYNHKYARVYMLNTFFD